MHTVAELLHETLQRHPTRRALSGSVPLGAASLDRATRGAATAIAPYQRADRPLRIGLLAHNSAETAIAFLASLYAGATIAPLHGATPLLDLRRIATLLDLDLLIADRDRAAIAAELGLPLLRTEALAAIDDPGEPPRLPPGQDPGDAPALLLTTSGTTGAPRAVAISHRSLLTHTRTLAHEVLSLGPRDRVLATLPIAHSFGCRMALLAPLLAGASVTLAPRFSASATLATLEAEAITWVPVVPTMLTAWLAQPRRPLPHLRWVLSAGAPLPEPLRADARAALGAEIRQGYGLTEASFCCIDAPPDPTCPGSVGRAVPGVEVRVVAPPGEVGPVEVRGDNLMSGYLDDPAGTRDAFTEDGWLRTGDIGALDAEGRLTITDRVKDIILSGGHTIYPAEVEAALQAHPAIAAVAVIGLPDPFRGEAVGAFVVLDRGAGGDTSVAALTAFAAERLVGWKVPTVWRFIPRLPTGPSGKVLRRVLREG